MSKKILVLLIIGITLLGTGVAILVYNASEMEKKYPDLILFFNGELKQKQSSSTPIDLFEGENVVITVISPTNKIFFSLTGPDNEILEKTVFSESLSHHLAAKTNGTYTVEVGNMETHAVNVIGALTDKPISNDEFVSSITGVMIAGSFLILIGFIIFIASIVILILKKIRSKNNSKIANDFKK
jgi:uncharacterized membrane protein